MTRANGTQFLNVRQRATAASPALRRITTGHKVGLVCWSAGQSVRGPYGTSTIWYKVAGGGWVTDSYLETRSSQPVTSHCDEPSRLRGTTRTTNTGAAGNCTWGVYHLFKQYSGVYPALNGNAKDLFRSAQARGWSTVMNAQVNSIVVFQPGVHGANRTYGHAAWVRKVERRSDGLYILVREMNFKGKGVWSERWVKDIVGMSFILAPRR